MTKPDPKLLESADDTFNRIQVDTFYKLPKWFRFLFGPVYGLPVKRED